MLSAPAFSGLGIYIVGDTETESGSLGMTIGSSYIGWLTGLLISEYVSNKIQDSSPNLDSASHIVLPIMMSVVSGVTTFNSTRYYKQDVENNRSIINAEPEFYKVNLPLPYLKIDNNKRNFTNRDFMICINVVNLRL
ncbi:MAG: hypothetical protein SVZ03_00110 [Spirochaetota bacterium]|nr:hypothetical protein [Spirochaetota bacterium]